MNRRLKFFDDENPITQMDAREVELREEVTENRLKTTSTFTEGSVKYRSEQLVIIKIGGVIENHADTKLEYLAEKIIKGNEYFVKVDLIDQIVKIQPAYLQESLDLMSKIDVIKSNALLRLNPETGKIQHIENFDEILANWLQFKNSVEENTRFVKSTELQENIKKYLDNTELQFTQDHIQDDFRIRPFFDLFFDKYLVSDDIKVENYPKLYYSQLFDRLPLELNVAEQFLTETSQILGISKHATLNRDNTDLTELEKSYDLKFKPKIGYKFDNYNFECRSQINYNRKENLLEDAWMTVSEEVKNNIEVFVDYKIRRIVS